MQRGGRLLIVLGIVLGLITGVMVYSATRAPTATKAPTASVVVTVQEVPARVTLQASMLAVKEWPLDALPPDAVTSIDDAAGKITLVKLYSGEPLMRAKLTDAKEAKSLTFALPAGMVAFSFPVDDAASVSGALQPGDTVDVLVSLKLKEADTKGNESKDQPTSQLTLQDVIILAVGAWTPAPQPADTTAQPAEKTATLKTVTLLVNQQDALVLKFANEEGQIDLALRSFSDHDPVSTQSVYAKYMIERFGFARPPIIISAPASK
jgi:pilus assembly protein CpaB